MNAGEGWREIRVYVWYMYDTRRKNESYEMKIYTYDGSY